MTLLHRGPCGYGYRPDTAAHIFPTREPPTRAKAAKLPDSIDLSGLYPPILNQRNTGSCTGFGTSALYSAAAKRANRPLPWLPSPRTSYTLGRCIERERLTPRGVDLPPLEDGGAMPSDVVEGGRIWGIRAAAADLDTECTPDNVNDEPTFSELLQADALKFIGPERISYGADIASLDAAIREAMAAGDPVGWGFFVDSTVMDWDPAKGCVFGEVNTSDPNGGGHWIALDGYRRVNGQTQFRMRNSWGAEWCDHGCIWVAASYILPVVSDPTRFTVTP